MFLFLNLPLKIVRLFSSNVSASEIAAGVCMAMFMGFIPLNGVLGVLLFILFFVFKINRLTAMLLLPLFKLLYVLGVVNLTEMIGGWVLIDITALKSFWNLVTGLPVLAYFDLGNTLVTGGLLLSTVLLIPVYPVSKKVITILQTKYASTIGNSKLIVWFKKLPLISKLFMLADKARGINS